MSPSPTNPETASLASSTRPLAPTPSSPPSMITVPIPLSALLTPEEITRLDTYRGQCDHTFWITRLINRQKEKKQGSAEATKERVKDVRMSREEYEAYWVRDEEGRYVGTEPEGRGAVIVRGRLWAELGLFGKSARTGKSERDRYV